MSVKWGKGQSDLKYDITKHGYYPERGMMFTYDSSGQAVAVETNKVILTRPIDYLDNEFSRKNSNNNLIRGILEYIDFLIINENEAVAILLPRTVKLASFKNKQYLQFEFITASSYNSQKLNKYDIGKLLFDEMIRRSITQLGESVNSERFDGFNLKVIAFYRDFSKDSRKNSRIEYGFYISKQVVESYKNNDITGQQVLDKSIILMDGERIELKLQ